MGCGGDQMVSLLSFHSNDPISNPAVDFSFCCKICVWKERKLTKRGQGWPILKNNIIAFKREEIILRENIHMNWMRSSSLAVEIHKESFEDLRLLNKFIQAYNLHWTVHFVNWTAEKF